jgi:hypothetical protein
MKRPAVINEPKERLSATLEEHLKLNEDRKKDRNYGAQIVRRAFKPIFDFISRIEKSRRGREALGFVALTLTRQSH